MTIVCITGMHRSGTSMTARLLNLCGLDLGEHKNLMPSDSHNAEGYWENLDFVEINDSLLAFYKGKWNDPPGLDVSFELSQIPKSIVKKAKTIIQKFEGEKFWGWKDPRTSLTLPFWQQLIPDLKIIICLRSPYEIAQSLLKRDKFPRSFTFELWHTYTERLLQTTKPENRLITSYNSYFINPQDELSRILKFIGISPDKEKIQNACKFAVPSLRHSDANFETLIAAGVPLKVIKLYVETSQQAETSYWNMLSGSNNNKFNNELLDRLSKNDQTTETLISYLYEKEKELGEIFTQLNMKQVELSSIQKYKTWSFVFWMRKVFKAIFSK
jgi:hypothetical protein